MWRSCQCRSAVSSWKLNGSNALFRIAQNLFVNSPKRCDTSRSAIYSFLNDVARMAPGPFPYNLVSTCGIVESQPPVVVGFATKASTHCLDNIARVAKQVNVTRLPQSFESDRGSRDLSLLICRITEICANRPPDPFKAKQRYRGRPRFSPTITQA